MTDCTAFRHDLGAYVVDGLDAEEARVLAAHLEHCAACRAEHAELVSARSLLDLALEPPPRAPSRLRARVIAAATRRHTRRRWALATAAAVVAAALIGGGTGWYLAPSHPPRVAVPLEDVDPFEASGWVEFRPEADELSVHLDLEGLEPVEEPGVYEAWLSTTDERVVSIGQLTDAEDTVDVELSARGSMADYQGFWITAEPDGRDPAHEGPSVLRAPVPNPE